MKNNTSKTDTIHGLKSCKYPAGSIGHYQHHVDEHNRVKELAENAIGELAHELYMELDSITMILEDYLP